jgi:exopolysaccharide biosynthesis predicted pyruvyltransferase EpsI
MQQLIAELETRDSKALNGSESLSLSVQRAKSATKKIIARFFIQFNGYKDIFNQSHLQRAYNVRYVHRCHAAFKKFAAGARPVITTQIMTELLCTAFQINHISKALSVFLHA